MLVLLPVAAGMEASDSVNVAGILLMLVLCIVILPAV